MSATDERTLAAFERLEEENAKLRELTQDACTVLRNRERVTRMWEFYRDNCDGFKEPMRRELRNLDGYVSSVEAENAKLRDLARDFMTFFEDDDACEHCEISSECDKQESPYEEDCLMRGVFRGRMRELGVEVE